MGEAVRNADASGVRIGRLILFVVILAQDSPSLGVDEVDLRTGEAAHRLIDFVIGSGWVIRDPALYVEPRGGAAIEERGH